MDASELELVLHVRNEIVHCYPRRTGTRYNIPDWLTVLADKRLLFTLDSTDGDIGWHQKLQSYVLAAWCATAVADAAKMFAASLSQVNRESTSRGMVASLAVTLAPNFDVLDLRS